MGWCGYHLSAIIAHDVRYTDVSIDDPSPDWKDWEEYVLDDIVKDGLAQFQYAYDFGDNWNMTVKVQKRKNSDPLAPYPVCVSGKNAGPPEDVGSYPGFDRFIKIMRNKKHREYKELSEWWGDESFDPSYFSTEEVNSLIQDQDAFKEYVSEKFG